MNIHVSLYFYKGINGQTGISGNPGAPGIPGVDGCNGTDGNIFCMQKINPSIFFFEETKINVFQIENVNDNL